MIGGSRFWVRFLGGCASGCVRRPGTTVAVAVLLAAVAAVSVATRLEVRTSNLDLLDPTLPEVVAFRSFAARFGTPNMLVVAFEGGEGASRRSAVDRAARALRPVAEVARVFSHPPFRADLLDAFGLPTRFSTRDGEVDFLFVQPTDVESAATTIASFVDGVRKTIGTLGLESQGVRVGYTGLPRYALDDRDVIRRDIGRASVFSFIAVLALFAGAFRGLRDPILAMVVLAAASLVTAGIGAWFPGHLTLVSAFFFSILFGLGIDFGVHVVDGAEELAARGAGRGEALVEAVRRLAPGLGTGATTTALSFLILLFSGFRGFAELGLLAGIGVLTSLVAMVTLLPALSMLLPPTKRAPRSLESRRAGALLVRWQRPALATLLAGAAIAVAAGGGPPFDGDYLDLQPEDSEAVRIERRMVRDSDFAPQFAAFVVRDGAAAEALATKLRAEPSVASVRSIVDFEPLEAFGATVAEEWADFRSLHVAADGTLAVYAFPRGDVWDAVVRARFLAAMRRLDPGVTGMPVLADLFERRSLRALHVSATLAAVLLVALVAVDLRRPLRFALALLPTALAVAAMLGVQRITGLAFNPLNLLALPVVIGASEDSGVHLVHRFVEEGGNLWRTLAGTGRSILVCGLTTLLGFGSLVFASHRGLASLARLLTLGVGLSLLFSLLVLPVALRAVPARWLGLAPGGSGP